MYDLIAKMTQNPQRLVRLGAVMRLVPKPLVFALLWLAGAGLYRMAGRSLLRRVQSNMRELAPDMNDKQIRQCSKSYFRNLAFILYELLVETQTTDEAEAKRFRIEGEAHLREALKHGKGVILYTPHVGNFFYSYWRLSCHYDCLTVVTAASRDIRPIYLIFQGLGCNGLDYDTTPPVELIRKLRDHLANNGVVYLLGDFYRPQFPEATFFGKPSRSPGGAAALALSGQVPVVPCYTVRDGMFRHRLVFGEPQWFYRDYAKHQKREVTDRLNQWMESVIRSYPDQWFYWFNADERWVESG